MCGVRWKGGMTLEKHSTGDTCHDNARRHILNLSYLGSFLHRPLADLMNSRLNTADEADDVNIGIPLLICNLISSRGRVSFAKRRGSGPT